MDGPSERLLFVERLWKERPVDLLVVQVPLDQTFEAKRGQGKRQNEPTKEGKPYLSFIKHVFAFHQTSKLQGQWE